MKNNKVNKTARDIWKLFYNLWHNVPVSDEEFKPLIENIIEIAVYNSRGWKDLSLRLNEYLCDVSDYIRTQWRGAKCPVGMVFKSEILTDDQEDNSIVRVKWGLIGSEKLYTIKCKEKC